MPAIDAPRTALERNWVMIDSSLEGLDDETLARIPAEQCNSIAWLIWHLNRVMDTFIHTGLRGLPQIWITEGWAEKYGMAVDANDRGVGWTAEQVAAWKPPTRDVLLGYHQAVRDAAREYLDSLTLEDMEHQVVWPPSSPLRTTAAALGQMTWDIVAHGGQIAYLRGMYRGMGWHV